MPVGEGRHRSIFIFSRGNREYPLNQTLNMKNLQKIRYNSIYIFTGNKTGKGTLELLPLIHQVAVGRPYRCWATPPLLSFFISSPIMLAAEKEVTIWFIMSLALEGELGNKIRLLLD